MDHDHFYLYIKYSVGEQKKIINWNLEVQTECEKKPISTTGKLVSLPKRVAKIPSLDAFMIRPEKMPSNLV